MRTLELKLSETVQGPDGKPHVISTNHTISSAKEYASATNFSRYFLELLRDMDRNLDAAILEYKEAHKL